MIEDFPAAHSMDTAFFAIDAAGHVGIFDSGEDGHVPEGVDDARGTMSDLWYRRFPEVEKELDERGETDNDWLEGGAARVGMFCFDYSFTDFYGSIEHVPPELPFLYPYFRTGVPDLPLHVDQLPPDLRGQAKQLFFPGVDFASCYLIQPMEYMRCVLWSEEDAAYLCGDGRTVRPVPGEERRFTAFCKRLRAEYPEVARYLTFEAPEEKPKKLRRRRRKDEAGD